MAAVESPAMVTFNGAAPPWDEMNKSPKAMSERRGRKLLKGKWLSLDILNGVYSGKSGGSQSLSWALGLFSFDPLEVGKDEFGQIAAVTTFQHAKQRHAEGAQGLAKPEKIFRLQCAGADWVPHISVKAGGHGDELRLEILQIIQRACEDGTIGFARGARRHRIIETIFADIRGARAGIKRMQMNGVERDAGPVEQNGFRAVAMMQKPIGVSRKAWCPGGRMRLKTFSPFRAAFRASSAAAAEARA